MTFAKRSQLAGLAALAFALVVAPIRSSADKKNLPGSACVAESGANQGDMDYWTYPGTIWNTAASSRFVVCPVVMDDTASTDGFVSLVGRVFSVTANTLVCYARCCDNDEGGSCYIDTQTANASSYDTLTFDMPDSYAYGQCYMRCNLPSNGRVVVYQWEE